MEFLLTFSKVFIGMMEIFFIITCGILFLRFKLIDKQGLSSLTALTINLFLPCLIFNHLIKHFSFDHPADWWLYPILGIAISLLGFILATLIGLFSRDQQEKKELSLLIAFQNCGYLPLILANAIFSQHISQELFTRIFLFILGFNLIFWGFGTGFLQTKEKSKFELKKIINAPFISLILSLFFVAGNLRVFIPESVIRVTGLLGDCTLPVALISLGAILGGVLEYGKPVNSVFFIKVILGKVVIMPAIILILIWVLKLPELVALLLLIEAAMPSAVNLGVVAYHHQNTKYEIIGRAVLFTHLAGIITIPLFISLFFLIARG